MHVGNLNCRACAGDSKEMGHIKVITVERCKGEGNILVGDNERGPVETRRS